MGTAAGSSDSTTGKLRRIFDCLGNLFMRGIIMFLIYAVCAAFLSSAKQRVIAAELARQDKITAETRAIPDMGIVLRRADGFLFFHPKSTLAEVPANDLAHAVNEAFKAFGDHLEVMIFENRPSKTGLTKHLEIVFSKPPPES